MKNNGLQFVREQEIPVFMEIMKYQYSELLMLVLAATSFGEESVNGIYSGKQRVIVNRKMECMMGDYCTTRGGF